MTSFPTEIERKLVHSSRIDFPKLDDERTEDIFADVIAGLIEFYGVSIVLTVNAIFYTFILIVTLPFVTDCR